MRTWDEETEQLVEREMRTTVGRLLFNQILPDRLRFLNETMNRAAPAGDRVATATRLLGSVETAHLVDGIKSVGFKYATRGGMTIAVSDIPVPPNKAAMLAEADEQIKRIDEQFQRGLITDDERYDAGRGQSGRRPRPRVSEDMSEPDGARCRDSSVAGGSVWMMTSSGARGNKGNIGQLGGMRGLMADPTGRIIDVPVRSNFQEGMTVLEYFISTHGARKGLADTALRTADSGYLTRRLVDVAQDVITRDDDCGTEEGAWITRRETEEFAGTEPDAFRRRHRRSVRRRARSTRPRRRRRTRPSWSATRRSTRRSPRAIDDAGVDEVLVRSPLTCQSRYGVCRTCYGRNLATGQLVGHRRGGGHHRRAVHR